MPFSCCLENDCILQIQDKLIQIQQKATNDPLYLVTLEYRAVVLILTARAPSLSDPTAPNEAISASVPDACARPAPSGLFLGVV